MQLENKKIKKCKGCGLPLSTDSKSLAYTPNIKLDYCQRCFQLKHYGINSKNELSTQMTDDVLSKLNIIKRDWIFLINDIINIDFDVIKRYQNHPKICFIFNKTDLIVNSFNYEQVKSRLEILLKELKVKSICIILTSTINNVGIRKLFERIKDIKLNEKIYFIGKSNSGKSSLINALIKYSGSILKPLTISNYLNTTIDIRQVVLMRHNIIDAPGYNSYQSILTNLANLKDVGSIRIKQKIKPITFQINETQSFIIDNFCWLTCYTNKKASITFYLPNKIHVHRCKPMNLQRNLANPSNNAYQMKHFERISKDYFLIDKVNVLIEGLGLLSLSKVIKITLNTYSNVNVTILNNVII